MAENEKNPFVYVNSLSYDKNYLFDDEEKANEEYIPFLVNRGMSYHPDTVFHANLMNSFGFLDKKLQYDYYFDIVTKKKRYAKWAKKVKTDDLNHIMRVYSYNSQKAEIASNLLTKEQVEIIKKMCDEGGTK